MTATAKTKPCPDPQALTDFVEGSHDSEQQRALEAHFDSCDTCRQLVAALARATGSSGPAEHSAGYKLGRYSILNRVGQGGMGVVYEAYDADLDRKVALKLVRTDTDATESLEKRLVKEARSLARLSHPNVVAIHEVGSCEGQVFLAMEFVKGQTLARWLRSHSPTPKQIIDVLIDASRGLGAAHRAGIVHRDFKPSNVIVGDDGRVRVTDFGLARLEQDPVEAVSRCPATASRLTQTGMLAGTPAYLAPEAALGRSDAQSDQFSFFVTLYEALTGSLPFPAAPADARLAAIRDENSPSMEGIPKAIRRGVARGLSADPAMRFSDMRAAEESLAKTPKHKRRFAAAAALIGAGALALWGQSPDNPCAGGSRHLADIWNDQVRQGLSAVVHPSMWPGTQERLQRYASDWVQAHRSTCEDTHLHGEQSPEMLDVRMACLRRQLHDFQAVVAELGRPLEKKDQSRAIDLANSVQDVSRCSDPNALDDFLPNAVPDNLRQTDERLQARLSQARARGIHGGFQDAVDELRQISSEARKLGLKRTLGAALYVQARYMSELGDDSAEATYLDAIAIADIAGDDATRAYSWADLVYHLGDRGHYKAAERHFRLASAAAERSGNKPHLLANLQDHLGTSHFRQANYDKAKELYKEALTLRRSIMSANDPAIAGSLSNLGLSTWRQNNFRQAKAYFEESLSIYEGLYPSGYPARTTVEDNLAALTADMGDYERAVELIRRVLHHRESLVEPNSVTLVPSLLNLGLALTRAGRAKVGLPYTKRAYGIMEQQQDSHPYLPYVLSGLGEGQLALGELDSAKENLERSLSLQQKASDPVQVAETRFLLAKTLWRQRDGNQRSITLARQAEQTFAAVLARTRETKDVRAWLADNAGSRPRARSSPSPSTHRQPQPTP